MQASTQPSQAHLVDNLQKQMNVIMVQMGMILQAPGKYPERAEQTVQTAKKLMEQATDNFHSTLDEMETEVTRAKAVFMRDLQQLREERLAAERAAAPVQAQPPAPMIIDLDPPKTGQASAPVAPMMASSSPLMQNRPSPVAPFPDMGMGVSKHTPTATVPFHPVKAAEGKRPSPKVTPKPTPKSGPSLARPPNKPSPLVNSQKQTPKAPIPVQAPKAPAPTAAPPATSHPLSNSVGIVSAAHNPFTNAMFTLDPTNSDPQMSMDLTGFDNSTVPDSSGLDGHGLGTALGRGPAEPANMEIPQMSTRQNNNAGNDNSMGDLDHFFDLGGGPNSNFDDSFNNMDEFVNDDFNFDTFE